MTSASGRITTGTVTSADGTRIAYDRVGAGPVVVLVHGAFTGRSHPTLAEVARGLSPWFTVVNYDRRGRGDSGDIGPYAPQREVEDLAAIIRAAATEHTPPPDHPTAAPEQAPRAAASDQAQRAVPSDRASGMAGVAGYGSAMVFGGSSGAALALSAAAQLPAITRLALWEPPYHVDASAPALPFDFAARLTALVKAGRRGEAVERFMVEAAEVPAEAVAAMRADPSWQDMESLAHTLAYEAAVMGPDNPLPTRTAATLRAPTLVMNGAASPAWMRNAGTSLARALPHATHRLLDGQTHAVSPRALTPELLEFFSAH